MTGRLALMCFLAMFLIGVCSPSIQSQDADTETLKGITAVNVLIEPLPEGANVLGLTKEAIQTDVELKLRLAGLRVMTKMEGLLHNVDTLVYVSVNLVPTGEVANIEVQIHQNAHLDRNAAPAFAVTTWERGVLSLHPTAQRMRDNIKDLVDQFLNDWLSVNPKK
ncbi:MAG: hypothetical protein LAO19_20985 [Acidobacteriia bacterium]|nr:hypothetical protein [Terriglobia bacterium]